MYDADQTVRITATITNKDNGAVVDPTTVAWTVYGPDGSVSIPTAVQTGPGAWTVTFVPGIGGAWTLGVVTTNPFAAAQRKIIVNPIPV